MRVSLFRKEVVVHGYTENYIKKLLNPYNLRTETQDEFVVFLVLEGTFIEWNPKTGFVIFTFLIFFQMMQRINRYFAKIFCSFKFSKYQILEISEILTKKRNNDF